MPHLDPPLYDFGREKYDVNQLILIQGNWQRKEYRSGFWEIQI
jgi:hypothetical protein